MRSSTSIAAIVLLLASAHAAPITDGNRALEHLTDSTIDGASRLPVAGGLRDAAQLKAVKVLERQLDGFGGPLRKPTADIHAEADTPLADICADLNARDRARCEEELRPAPRPKQKESEREKPKDDDDERPKKTEPKSKPKQNNDEERPRPKPKTDKPKCDRCDEDDDALVRVHADVDLRPLLDLCLDIAILGERQECERDVRAGKKPKAQKPKKKTQQNNNNKPKSKPKAVTPHRPNRDDYPCHTGHRYSPVLEACVELTLGAPRPNKDGACPAHWAYDWELLVCVAVSIDAPQPVRGRCPDGWGMDAILAVCVNLDINRTHGDHYDGEGALIDAAAIVKLGGEREKRPTSDERSCPPGHRWDSIVGCSLIDAVIQARSPLFLH